MRYWVCVYLHATFSNQSLHSLDTSESFGCTNAWLCFISRCIVISHSLFGGKNGIKIIYLVIPLVLKLILFSSMFRIPFTSFNLTICFQVIADHPLLAFQSICRYLWKDSGTHVISWLLKQLSLYCRSERTFGCR